MQEIQVRCLGREDPWEKGMGIHSSILAWRIPWIEEPVMGSQRVRHDWLTNNTMESILYLDFLRFFLMSFSAPGSQVKYIITLVIMSLTLLGCDRSSFSLLSMTLTVLKITSQAFCRMSLSLNLSDSFSRLNGIMNLGRRLQR